MAKTVIQIDIQPSQVFFHPAATPRRVKKNGRKPLWQNFMDIFFFEMKQGGGFRIKQEVLVIRVIRR